MDSMWLGSKFEEAIDELKRSYYTVYSTLAKKIEENTKLKSEHYKDEEIVRLKEKIEELENRYDTYYGLTKSERKKVNKFMNEHNKNEHEYCGFFYYKFTPTGIGVCGEVVCGKCGKSFEFRDVNDVIK